MPEETPTRLAAAPKEVDRADVLAELNYRWDNPEPGQRGTALTIEWVLDELMALDILANREPADLPGTVKRSPDGLVVVLTDSKDSLRWVLAFGYGNGGKAEWFTDAEVADWPVIGAVPGTPAAESTALLNAVSQGMDHVMPCGHEFAAHGNELCPNRPPLHVDNEAIVEGAYYAEKARERAAGKPREFPLDGPEPPADVQWLEWTHPDPAATPRFIGRHCDGWVWASQPGRRIDPSESYADWPPTAHFSFREVPAGEVPQ